MKKRMIILYSFLGLVGLLVISTWLFLQFAPQIGQSPKGEHLENIKTSENYANNQFQNLVPTSLGDMWESMKKLPEMLKGAAGPKEDIPSDFELADLRKQDTGLYVTWFGHSAFLIELEGKRILLDPMLSERSSPLPIGTKRFNYRESIPLEAIQNIDAIIISHDHYDHLDYKSILTLKDKTKQFITALGVGSHLKRWGVEGEKITELDWWQHTNLSGINVVACPARHFSGRGLTDRNKTQWAGFALQGQNRSIYFSGDSGYGDHFKQIGEKLGPFDLAMLECGQYNELWNEIHMMPEESVEAAKNVKAKHSMPIHWGAFNLALHPWDEPALRFSKAAEDAGVSYAIPVIGKRWSIEAFEEMQQWELVNEKYGD